LLSSRVTERLHNYHAYRVQYLAWPCEIPRYARNDKIRAIEHVFIIPIRQRRIKQSWHNQSG
jgi:hypothetical protein